MSNATRNLTDPMESLTAALLAMGAHDPARAARLIIGARHAMQHDPRVDLADGRLLLSVARRRPAAMREELAAADPERRTSLLVRLALAGANEAEIRFLIAPKETTR